MGELHTNSEVTEVSSSPESVRPEPARISEGDKDKLTPRENDALRAKREAGEEQEGDGIPAHSKLNVSEDIGSGDTDLNRQRDPNENAHEKLTPNRPITENTLDKPGETGQDQVQPQPLDGQLAQLEADETGAEQPKPGLWDRIVNFFGKDEKPEDDAPARGNWDGLETTPAPNGSGWTILPGNHFDEYADIDLNSSDHPRTEIPKEDQTFRPVNPADIEGVYLGSSEVEDPDRFWSMHNGSKDAWLDTASHIPEVREKLDSGTPLDSLLQDERLGSCANAYFNPDNPQAIEVDAMPDGGYMFNGNGRHRVIAARLLGHEIPVKVVGQRD